MSAKVTLDYSLEVFETLLSKASKMVSNRYDRLDDAPTFAGLSPAEIAAWFDEPLPMQEMDPQQLLEQVDAQVMNNATMNIGPNFHAYVNTGGTQISIIAELLASAVNQNLGKWHLAPVMCEIEKCVIRWCADLIDYSANAGGVLVSGGSAANLAGLTVARNIVF